MKTRHVLHVFAALLLAGAILSCSFVPQVFTGGQGESQPSSAGEEESCEPIVGKWKQVVFHGLTGRKNTNIMSSEIFDKYVYSTIATVLSGSLQAGPSTGGEIWRTRDGITWEMVGEPGMGNPENVHLLISAWGDRLYVIARGTQFSLWVSQDGQEFHQLQGDWPAKVDDVPSLHVVNNRLVLFIGNREEGLQAWASSDGERFEKVLEGGLEDPASYTTVSLNDLPSLNDWSYLGIRNVVKGGEVWRSRDGLSWERSLKGGFDDPSNDRFLPQLTYGDHVYVEALNPNGVNVFRTADGEQWEKVVENGFGLGEHQATSVWLESYKEALYLVTNNDDPRAWGAAPSSASRGTGFRLWKAKDGKSWQQVGEPGFGNPNNWYAVINTHRCVFYLVALNNHDGNQVWRSTDGENWELFFTAPASQTNYGHGLSEIADGLEYFGYDMANGIQIWRYGP
jgi:hypothetical protein